MDFQDWVNVAAIVGGVLAVPALVLAILTFVTSRIDKDADEFESVLTDPASRQSLIKELRSGWSFAYLKAIRDVLNSADNFWGPARSFAAFDKCLMLAFLYPLVAVVISWAISNQHSPAGFLLFQDIANPAERGIRVLVFVAIFLLGMWLASKFDDIVAAVEDLVFKPGSDGSQSPTRLKRSASIATEFIVGLTVVVVAAAIAGGGYFFTIGFESGPNTILFAYGVAIALGVGAVGAVFIAVGVAVALGWFFSDSQVGSSAFLFFALFPILNAIADFASLAVTRSFLRQVKVTSGLLVLVGKLVLDLVWALICLGLLLGLMAATLDLWAWISPATVPIDRHAYWQAIEDDPWQGFAVYLMIFTTLLPTMFHVAAGLGAVITHRSRRMAQVASTLESKGAEPLSQLETLKIKRKIRGAIAYGRWMGWSLTLGMTAALGAGIIWVLV